MATRTISLHKGDAREIATLDTLMGTAFDPRWGEAWTHSQCLGVLAMPGVSLTLAMIDETPAGFAMVRSLAGEAELLLIAVARDMRRRGIGGALLRAAIADASASGAGALHLEVRAGNDAVRLYTDHGFAKVGERRGYYRGKGASYDAHTYRRSLTA